MSPLNHWQVRKWNHVCQNVPVDTATYWATLVLDFCNAWKPQRLWCHLCQVGQHQAGDCLSKGSNCHLSQMCHLDKSISSTFVHRDKPLVIQFTLKHEQNIDCSGGYIKLFDCKLDQVDMHGQSPYNIMFSSGSCDLAPRRSTSALSTRARTT